MEKRFKLSLKYLLNEISHHPSSQHFGTGHANSKRRKVLLRRIEEIVLKTVNSAVSTTAVPSLIVKPRRSQWKDCNFDRRLTLKERQGPPFEIKYTTHKKRFDIIFNLLSKIYRLLLTKSFITKRELYYEQTELFGSQTAVTAALSDICWLLNACPWELRVLSTSKGLVAGTAAITTRDGETLHCDRPGGVLVPQDVKGIKKIESPATFILLVEKDAAFQKLLDDGAHLKYGPSIIITGKGEPDVNTRLLVHRLWQELRIPIFAIVDADPYGIEIMCTYRFGSLTMSSHSEHLATPQVRWLGIHPSDMLPLHLPSVPLTPRDLSKARELAARPYMQQNQQLLDEVNCLLEGGKKCEIENLTALSPNFLTNMFISYKITEREVI